MGTTAFSISLLEKYVFPYLPKGSDVTELGAQYLYDTAEHCLLAVQDKPEFAKTLYQSKGYKHTSIDINGEADLNLNLCQPIELRLCHLLTDFGTLEHVDDLWAALENCHRFTKKFGFMVHENPKVGNWPGHGNHYFTCDFWFDLAKANGYEILTGETAAMGNTTDGWNVWAVLQKLNDEPFKRPII